MEEYEEVSTDYEYEEEMTAGDVALIIGVVILGCMILAFIMYLIKKTFKNVHLKIGNKVEIGIETKEENKI